MRMARIIVSNELLLECLGMSNSGYMIQKVQMEPEFSSPARIEIVFMGEHLPKEFEIQENECIPRAVMTHNVIQETTRLTRIDGAANLSTNLSAG